MTTGEGNKLIAEFLGWEFTPNSSNEIVGRFNGFARWILSNKEFDDLLLKGFVFHSEWNKLMPVVEKISLIPLIGAEHPADTCHPITFNMPTEDGKTMVRFKGCGCFTADTLIQAAWLAVVDFIEFNNQQTEKA